MPEDFFITSSKVKVSTGAGFIRRYYDHARFV